MTPSAHLLPPQCPRSVTSVTKIRLRFLRPLRFFAAKFPNPFTPDYADSADKKSVSVLSVPSCKIRPCIPYVPCTPAPARAGSSPVKKPSPSGGTGGRPRSIRGGYPLGDSFGSSPSSSVSALCELCDTFRFLRLMRFFAANPPPRAERTAHPCDPPIRRPPSAVRLDSCAFCAFLRPIPPSSCASCASLRLTFRTLSPRITRIARIKISLRSLRSLP